MSLIQAAPLPEVSTIVMGQSPPGSSYNEAGAGLPFFQGKAEFGELSPTPKKWCTEPQRIAECGDVLMSVRAPVGPTNLASERCCIGRGLAAIRANPARLDGAYLRFFLRFAEPRLAAKGQGSTFAAIGRAEIASLHIPLPSLDEQRRIVDLLARAEGIVRLCREAQQKAAELIPAIFIDMFGDPATNPKQWPVRTLGEVLDAIDYGSSTKASTTGDGLPIIRMGNVTTAGDLDLDDLKFVELSENEAERFRLRKGDLLFNRTNSKELVGKTGLWDGSLDAVVASYFIRLRAQPDVAVPSYLWAWMNSRHMKRVLFDTARGAIGQANINSRELRAFRIAVPPLKQQQSFDAWVHHIRSLCRQQAEALIRATATFDALLSRAFN